jgi:sugar lactone lactonase YvrE
MIWNGVTTAAEGRVFVDFPHLDNTTGVRVAEISKDSSIHPYPEASWNQWSPGTDAYHAWVRPNALRIGPDGNLWVVDSGASSLGGTVVDGGAKIVVFNLSTNQVARTYPFNRPIIGPKSYIDDIRFNGHMAYITDAGVPGLILMNLDTGAQRRVLDHDRSTTDERPMFAEGRALRTSDGKLVKVHADQLEVTPNGKYLYFQPASGPLYRIETRWLDDPAASNAEISRHVELWYDTPPTGGTAIDADGNLYVTDVNKLRILKITPEKKMTVLVSDPRLIWADALWIDDQGDLWIPQAQLNRMAPFNNGISRVQLPVYIFKLHIGARPFLGIAEHRSAVPAYSSGGTRAPGKTKASFQESYGLLHHKLKLVMSS